MDDQNKEELYPSNSFNIQRQPITKTDGSKQSKSDRNKVVASGKEKKKTFGRRVLDSFFTVTKEEIQNRFIDELLIPGIKHSLEDFVHFILFQDRLRPSRRRDRDDDRGGLRRIDYSGRYSDEVRDSFISRRAKQPELVFDTRDEAEEVLQTMFEYLDDYKRVTVKDLYTLADMPTNYTMTDWGWYDLSDAVVLRCEEGFLLQMPKVRDIRR